MREATVKRKTKETDISCTLTLDGEGIAKLETGIGFFDHMLNTLAKHGGFNLDFTCKGDLNVDTHHSVEDSGIVLGDAFNKALVSKDGIQRYANFVMPMDDALVLCAVDLCGRAYYESNATFNVDKVGDFETETVDEFFRSFADNAKINLHFVILRGENSHHIIEAMFKSLAKCLRDAIKINSDIKGSLSTKGVI
ncbi:imidazoleglycerol-phosphate dehydratase [Anaeroplasma bactoclasticum]|jgi:imidazoleglycerol-phosphate dehydratase|uniref:Imidazoleglycerol-phosphate dehydratase n=1 Tax=Anaeroplasma bactoclasticum TaxID=2088 RepID=A0A397RZ63_9MOLU|nr:imidazoleglycerol-phosphate dehydratase HisB [Anaeroplasma bactoclasticum]RIA75691.1 imidazoleglycerol-phosphate dehydratase [Anaeroplasma bactoclasticum]